MVQRAAEAEGLARTFLLAAPLVERDPGLTVGGVTVRDFYAAGIVQACDPASPHFWGKSEEVYRDNGGRPGQQLVEVAALCLGLMNASTSIWAAYSAGERALVASLLRDYAEAETHPHNWRFFNVLISAFLESKGWPVDTGLADRHLRALLAYYAGDGWYRDGNEFDYYSAWAFQFYGPIWCRLIGYRTRPALAAIVERRHGELMAVYPHFFGRGGESLLWGRSAAYRCAASAPLVASFFLNAPAIAPGLARRIASGNLLQFLTREDLWTDGVPGLGFYRPFEPCVQSYSCSASPFWLAKVYQALALPPDSPFWTAVEDAGEWRTLGRKQVVIQALGGPGLVVTQHGASGAAECRPGKVSTPDPLYQRLVFNTAFPWEADDPAAGSAMGYALRGKGEPSFSGPVAMRYGGLKGDVLYRQALFARREGSPVPASIDLAEIILPDGILRVDRVHVPWPYELRLGHFGLPHLSGRKAVVAEFGAAGISARIPARAVFAARYRGWDQLVGVSHQGRNAEAEESTVLYAIRRGPGQGGSAEIVVLLLLYRTNDQPWTEAERDPVETLTESSSGETVRVVMKDGREYCVDFTAFEGALSV